MGGPDTSVAYLVRIDEGLAPVRRFLAAYTGHDPGMAHHLLVLRRGFRTEREWAPFASAFDDHGVQHGVIDLADAGYDLGAYRAAVMASGHDYLCFLNTFSEVLCDGWLEHLHRSAQLPGVGLAGATGSYESVYSASVAALSGPQRDGTSRWHRGLRQQMHAYRLRYQFPEYPNPHIRTNGFMLRRRLALTLRWGPYRTKHDALRGESGRFGLARQAASLGLRNLVVGRNGLAYEPDEWPLSRTFRSGDQSNLMIADNRTRQYSASPIEERLRLGRLAWGGQYLEEGADAPHEADTGD